MKFKPLSFTALFIFPILLLNATAYGQNQLSGDQMENLLSYWRNGLNDVQKQTGADEKNFNLFLNFYNKQLLNEQGNFYTAIKNGLTNPTDVKNYVNGKEKEYLALYKKFLSIEKEYPSSVDEVINPPKALLTCNPGCSNIDFEEGTLNDWNAYYGNNSSYALTYFNITSITGGPAGAVTKAALDPLTNNSYQVSIMSGAGHDPIATSIPVVSPFGGNYSVRLGDSSNLNYGVAILSQQFTVTAANSDITYSYAVLLQNPPGHTYYEQPFLTITLFDQNGDTIPSCGQKVIVGGFNQGFDSLKYAGEKLYYKNWVSVSVPLTKYIGQCVTIQFMTADCALGGHFGYAYIDASCSPSEILSSSPNFCGQKYITLTAPFSNDKYKWTGPTGGIVSADTLQSIQVDSAGTYTLVTSPLKSGTCDPDTLTITIGKVAGPVPVPSFTSDTACPGSAMSFTNTSNPLAGGNFYWDFNNSGIYLDSTVNPTWTYNYPGVYTVKLHEVYNGCGADTLITVKVDTSALASFSFAAACAKQPVNFVNSSSGATKYKWDFGDPASGNSDTSSLANPTHSFDTAGSYSVTLVATNGSCPDTLKQTVTINVIPVPTITGTDSVCLGNSTFLTATAPGATSYTWSYPSGSLTCPTCAATSVTPTVTTTYTVTASNGLCSGDTTYTVYVKPVPTPKITASSDTVCLGDSAMLVASGGCTYLWTNSGQTSDSIWVKPSVNTTYYLQASCQGCSAGTNLTIVVRKICCTNSFTEQICVVTVDTSINKYEIIWEKLSPPPGGYYDIYKENKSFAFNLIDSQSVSSFSTYTDLASNPSAKTETYEIGTYDSCGYSSLSAPHTPCLLSVTPDTGSAMMLNWTAYLGFTVNEYYIYRGLSPNSLVLTDSVPGSSLTYIDSNPPKGSMYLIKAVSNTGACTPSIAKQSSAENLLSSLSNIFDTKTLGINNLSATGQGVSVYPIPAENILVLQFEKPVYNEKYQVINTLGQVLGHGVINGEKYILNVSTYASGLYLIQLTDAQNISHKQVKFIKQ